MTRTLYGTIVPSAIWHGTNLGDPPVDGSLAVERNPATDEIDEEWTLPGQNIR